jgi:uncharacterized phiE125 gp8 family phage protein
MRLKGSKMIPTIKMKVLSVGSELITLDEAREHLKLDTYGSPEMNDEDDLVTRLITAARERIENYLNISIVPKEVETAYETFCKPIQLYGPVEELISVKYFDEVNVEQTLAPETYTLDEYSKVPMLVLNYGYHWPRVYNGINMIRIVANVGYTDNLSPNDNPCPKAIIAAMLLTIGHLFKNRESTTDLNLKDLPDGITSLIYPYRVQLGV